MPDKEQKASASTTATTSAEGEANPAAPTTALSLAPDVQNLIPPIGVIDILPPSGSSTIEEVGDARMQTAADLIQSVLLPTSAGQTPVGPDTAIAPVKAHPAVALSATTTETMPTLGPEASRSATPRGESTADVRLDIARSAGGEASTNGGNLPARLAAPHEAFPLPTETHSVPATELPVAKSEAGMAQAAASIVSAVPMQVAVAAAQPRHGSEYQIVTPVGSQHWETAVGNSLVIMSGARQDRAELVLTPPQFGRIEVSISMKGDEATAMFVSANPAVREALESALPRLREVLAEVGITLGQTQVGAESQGQSASERQNGDNASRRGISDAAGDGGLPVGAGNRSDATHRIVSRSLVDTYV